MKGAFTVLTALLLAPLAALHAAESDLTSEHEVRRKAMGSSRNLFPNSATACV